MKKTIILTLSVMMTSSVWSQNPNANNQQQRLSKGEKCLGNGVSNAFTVAKTTRTTSTTPLPLVPCEQLKLIAVMNDDGGAGFDTPDMKSSMDGKVTCIKDGGYTADFKDCARAKSLYDTVILAEKAMFAQQTIRVNESNVQQNADISKAVAQGDTQYAAIDAVMKRNEINHKLNQTQARIYQSSVLALGAGVSKWQGKNNFTKLCQQKMNALQTEVKTFAYAENFSVKDCEAMTSSNRSAIFKNDDARTKLIAELGTLVQKAAEAMRRAGINEDVAKRMENNPALLDDPTTALNFCFNNPTHAECVQNNGHNLSSGTLTGNTVDFGAGTGANQNFEFDPSGTANLGDDPLGTGSDTGKVADMTSPFEARAKEASGILNPAGAASVTPGSQSSPPGGGGGGGGGGAGGASLGDDLAGAKAEDSGDPEIKTNKVAGKYKGGGAGFQGVGKSGGKDTNPFASLFDSKGESGGIEEDRSIASDMGGEGSGLFQKISKKYGQIQKDNRIESQNLE